MCPRCAGYLVRDRGFQTVTHEGPAYHCVNCGNYIDMTILRNKEIVQHDTGKRPRQPLFGDDSVYVFNGSGGILAGSSLLDLL